MRRASSSNGLDKYEETAAKANPQEHKLGYSSVKSTTAQTQISTQPQGKQSVGQEISLRVKHPLNNTTLTLKLKQNQTINDLRSAIHQQMGVAKFEILYNFPPVTLSGDPNTLISSLLSNNMTLRVEVKPDFGTVHQTSPSGIGGVSGACAGAGGAVVPPRPPPAGVDASFWSSLPRDIQDELLAAGQEDDDEAAAERSDDSDEEVMSAPAPTFSKHNVHGSNPAPGNKSKPSFGARVVGLSGAVQAPPVQPKSKSWGARIASLPPSSGGG